MGEYILKIKIIIHNEDLLWFMNYILMACFIN